MSPRGYERVRYFDLHEPFTCTRSSAFIDMTTQVDTQDHDNDAQMNSPLPSSPPPSFRSRASSPASRHLLSEDPISGDADRTLADTFDDGQSSDDEDTPDDRQRLMRADPEAPSVAAGSSGNQPDPRSPELQRRVTELPAFTPSAAIASRGPRQVNDGVFANLAAKPEKGEKNEELPPVRHDLPKIFIPRIRMNTDPLLDLRASCC